MTDTPQTEIEALIERLAHVIALSRDPDAYMLDWSAQELSFWNSDADAILSALKEAQEVKAENARLREAAKGKNR